MIDAYYPYVDVVELVSTEGATGATALKRYGDYVDRSDLHKCLGRLYVCYLARQPLSVGNVKNRTL